MTTIVLIGIILSIHVLLAPLATFFIFNHIKRHLPRNFFEFMLMFLGWSVYLFIYLPIAVFVNYLFTRRENET